MSYVVISVDREGRDVDAENQVVNVPSKELAHAVGKEYEQWGAKNDGSLVSHVNGDRWVRGRT